MSICSALGITGSCTLKVPFYWSYLRPTNVQGKNIQHMHLIYSQSDFYFAWPKAEEARAGLQNRRINLLAIYVYILVQGYHTHDSFTVLKVRLRTPALTASSAYPYIPARII